MTTFLLTNDDGYQSPGLAALRDKLVTLGQVYIVAPESEQSGVSHALTLMRPLRLTKRQSDHERVKLFTVDGTPADCVKLALDKVLQEPPEMVIAGINRGANTGVNILYSGTVAAATEGTLAGIPSIALSRASLDNTDFGDAASVGVNIIKNVLEAGLPSSLMLNVNIPNLKRAELRSCLITHQGERRYRDSAVENTDPRHLPYYWLKMTKIEFQEDPLSDDTVLRQGNISITPLLIDRTAHSSIPNLGTLQKKIAAGLS